MIYNMRTPAVVQTGWRSNHPPVIRGNTAMADFQLSTISKCLHCGKDFLYRKYAYSRFCSYTCRIEWFGKEIEKTEHHKCQYCEKDIFDGGKNKKYCSNVCKKKARTVRHGGTPRARLEPRTRPIVDGQRQCVKCDQWKPIEEFPKSKTASFGIEQFCKRCVADVQRVRMAESRKKNPEMHHQNWLRHQQRQAEKQGRVYVYSSKRIGRHKVWTDQERLDKEYDRVIFQNARDAFDWWFAKKTDKQVAAWYEATGKPWNNPKLSDAEKWKMRYALDLDFHLKQKLRLYDRKIKSGRRIGETIRLALKRGGECPSLIYVLDYDMKELKVHLEKQFTKGMSWDKFVAGEIHIDHIIPVSRFDTDDRQEIKLCWALPNLRPMWAGDNIRKGATVMNLL